MAKDFTIVKRYEDFSGLDLRSSDVKREVTAVSSMRNARYVGLRTITSRRGNKTEQVGFGGYGLLEYLNSDTTTGAITREILSVGALLYRRVEGSIALTYSGSGTPGGGYIFDPYLSEDYMAPEYFGGTDSGLPAVGAVAVCLVDEEDETWHFQLYNNGTSVLDHDLGVGFNEAAPVDLTALKTAIDAIDGFTCTITGDATVPAAFMETTVYRPIADTISIPFFYYEAVPQPDGSANPFQGTYTARNSDDFEICSSENLNNVLFIGSKYDDLKKYDGQKVYRAGLPEPSVPSGTPGIAGNVDVGTHRYWVSYAQKDAQDNYVEGPISSYVDVVVAGSASTVSITLPSIQPSTGFNTDSAVVSGTQTAVNTIVCVPGVTLKVGDTAYFYNSSVSEYVEREVTAVTNTSITVAGAPVSVGTGRHVSANLRLKVWRTTAGGTEPYLAAEVPNATEAMTQAHADNVADTDLILNERYLTPLYARSLPPRGGYLTSHQGLLVVGGILAAPNTLYWSDTESPEYFDYEELVEEVKSAEPIRGIKGAREYLAVFKPNSYYLISGTLYDGNYRVDLASSSVGCASHASIADIREQTVFLGASNFYALGSSGVAEPFGDNVSPLLTGYVPFSEQEFMLRRAIAVNDIREECCLFFLPCESETGGEVYANEYSRVLVYDYYRQCWYLWDGLNFAGGAVASASDLYFLGRDYSDTSASLLFRLSRRIERLDDYAYVDHNVGLKWNYLPGWEALGEPSTFKKANRLRVFAADPSLSPSFVLDVKTELDYVPGAYHTVDTLTLGSGNAGSGWSVTPWGVLWGDPAAPTAKTRLKATRCQSIRVGFYHNTLYRRPVISGWELEFAASFRPEIKD